MPEATATAATAPGASPCWLVLHELRDTSAAPLVEALAAARPGQAVHALSSTALMAWVRWQSRLDAGGASCRLQLPGQPGLDLHAGRAATGGLRLAGVVNRLQPLALPAAVEDADYKSAEWQALCHAWLHGLPVPVLNRPRCADVLASARSPVRWRQLAARAGLPIWPLAPTAVGDGAVCAVPPDAAPAAAGWLVVGDQTLPASGGRGPRWPPALQQAAARAVREAGLDVLAWTGGSDAQGVWRVSGATPWPDLRSYGPAALQAHSDWLDRARPDATCAAICAATRAATARSASHALA